MFFTQDDYKKIQQWLIKNSVKDTEFNEANIPFNGEEIITIVQGNQNKKVFLKDLIAQVFNLGISDFVNITDKYDAPNISLEEAIRLIPSRARKEGQVITFLDREDHWHIYQFKGVLNQWNILDQWEDLFDWEKLIIDSILPDEEDLTKSLPDENGNSYLSLKDREYNPEDFSGLGRVILRKNIVEIEDPIYGKVKNNYLYQDMFTQSNTIYEIRYDFDLNSNEIIIPEGCVLDFQGGSISNGTINFNYCTIMADTKVFKDITIESLSKINIKWFVDNDITTFITGIGNVTQPLYIYFENKEYICKRSIVLPPKVYLIGEGEQKNRTSITFTSTDTKSTLITYTWKCGIDNIDITAGNSDFEGVVILLSNKNYQDYDGPDPSYPGWIIKDSEIKTYWRSDSNYKDTAIKIEISNGTEGDILLNRSFSYSRQNFANLKIQYFKFGIDIYVHQETLQGDIDNKVWSNSVLFDNIEIWANDAGIRFITKGVDGDTGNYSVNNYMFQAIIPEDGDIYDSCAFSTNDSKHFSLLNLIVWDVKKHFIKKVANPYTLEDGVGGTIIVSSTKSFKIDDETKNNFTIVSTGSSSPSLHFKALDYDSSTGKGDVKVFAEDDTFKVNMVPYKKTTINWKVTDVHYCSSHQWVTDYNGFKLYEDIATKTPYVIPNVGNQVFKHSTLINTSTGEQTLAGLEAIPCINKEIGLFSGHLPYGLYVLRCRADFSVPLVKRSTYSIPFVFEDVYEYDTPHSIMSCGVMSLGYDTSSIGAKYCNILGHQFTKYGGYIIVQAGDTDVSYFSVTFLFMMSNDDGTPCLRHIKRAIFGEPQLIRQQFGESLLTFESSNQIRPTLGMSQFLNPNNKPYWYGNNGWVDANGIPYNTKTSGTFEERSDDVPIGFAYFCTNKNTSEGATDGIMIYHKGNNVWVDALGRVVE